MYVREYMNTEAITLASEASLDDALKLMEASSLNSLFVEDGDRLVGFVTQDEIRAALDMSAIEQGNADLPDRDMSPNEQGRSVASVMEREFLTVSPDMSVEEAVALAQPFQMETLPVVVEGDQLIGMVMTADLYRAIVEAINFGPWDVRLHIRQHPKHGHPLGEIFDIINGHGARILSLFHNQTPGISRTDCILHLETERISDLLKDLKLKGYEAEASFPSATFNVKESAVVSS
jgi:acetoin utilization protein AcuB